jgi:hypothetical protein
MDPGLKGCQYLLGKLPTWISLTEREKMEVRREKIEQEQGGACPPGCVRRVCPGGGGCGYKWTLSPLNGTLSFYMSAELLRVVMVGGCSFAPFAAFKPKHGAGLSLGPVITACTVLHKLHT